MPILRHRVDFSSLPLHPHHRRPPSPSSSTQPPARPSSLPVPQRDRPFTARLPGRTSPHQPRLRCAAPAQHPPTPIRTRRRRPNTNPQRHWPGVARRQRERSEIAGHPASRQKCLQSPASRQAPRCPRPRPPPGAKPPTRSPGRAKRSDTNASSARELSREVSIDRDTRGRVCIYPNLAQVRWWRAARWPCPSPAMPPTHLTTSLHAHADIRVPQTRRRGRSNVPSAAAPSCVALERHATVLRVDGAVMAEQQIATHEGATALGTFERPLLRVCGTRMSAWA